MLRSVTGIEVADEGVDPLDVSTIEPEESPGVGGVVALTLTVWLWPGASVNVPGDTEPNDTNFWLLIW